MKNIQSLMLTKYSDSNTERFNDDLLTLKEKEDPKKYLEVAMNTLNSIEGITYLRMEEIQHKVYQNLNTEEKEKSNLNISVDKSILKIYRFYFNIQKDDFNEDISFDLFFPILLKGQYYLINDNRYFPTYQLLDSSFFNSQNAVTLKTLITPIKLELKTMKNPDDNYLSLNIFKKKISPFYYYFAKFGFDATMEYFGLKDSFIFVENLSELSQYENEFKIYEINKKLYFCVDLESYSNNNLIYNTIADCFNTRIKLDKINDIDYWKKKLGTLFSNTTDKIGKANSTLISFERALDLLNKEILRLDPDDKKDIYSLIKYMIVNFEHLLNRDNCDLANKRIRSTEYLVYPLLRKYTSFVRRINNSRKITPKKLQDFVCSKGFLIKCMLNNPLLRYDSSCNSINCISKLKISQGGIQSQFNSGSVKIEYRTNHPSYVGRLGLLETSASSPGESMLFTPFCKLYDTNHFTEKES